MKYNNCNILINTYLITDDKVTVQILDKYYYLKTIIKNLMRLEFIGMDYV